MPVWMDDVSVCVCMDDVSVCVCVYGRRISVYGWMTCRCVFIDDMSVCMDG